MSVAMSVGESDGGKAVAMWLWLCGCGRVAVTIRVPGDLRESGFTGWQLCDENERMR